MDYTGSVIMITKGVMNYSRVTVVNSYDPEIILKKNMTVRRVELIKSLVSLEVKLHQQSAKVSSITSEDIEEKQVTEEQQKSVTVA